MPSERLHVANPKRASSDFLKRDRTARLLGMAHLLFRRSNGVTAYQIADHTGTHVRAIYRDVRALEQEFLSVRLMARYQDHRDPHVISACGKLASILPAPIGRHVRASLINPGGETERRAPNAHLRSARDRLGGGPQRLYLVRAGARR
jgi:hypothetical protein